MAYWIEAPAPDYLQILEVSPAVLMAISRHQPKTVESLPEPSPGNAKESMQSGTAAAHSTPNMSPSSIHALSVQAAAEVTGVSPMPATAARSKRRQETQQAGSGAKKRKIVTKEVQPQVPHGNADAQRGKRGDDTLSEVLLSKKGQSMEAGDPTISNSNGPQPGIGRVQPHPSVDPTARTGGDSSSSLDEESWQPPVQHPRAGYKRCLACKLTFRDLLAFQSHFDGKHQDDASDPSDLCTEETSSGVLVCGECGDRVKRVNFGRHCNRHRGTNVRCPGCGAEYVRNQSLYRHQARAKSPCSRYEPAKKNGKYIRQKLVKV
ncbi:MAG: hypothetical protein OHK93_001263 [Ramalina farinacea]|uniref:C2H2-type domain-containing protein n=1 Tax=Ramalina farinacea TaxID=258253 RepID=A0AA43TW29_9LECA|nr:hypothetical protein [Ramalina farinacea]